MQCGHFIRKESNKLDVLPKQQFKPRNVMRSPALPTYLVACLLASSAFAAPDLVPGVWTQIGPTAVTSVDYGTANVAIDPSNPDRLYIGTDQLGMWKSSDRGSTWSRMGNPADRGFPTSGYLDMPIQIAIDPANSQRMYATVGVRGQSSGFWVSTNGGVTWTVPLGFRNTNTTLDMTQMSVNAANFNHVILSSHSPWPGRNNAGILETRDGGVTWTAHPPVASWPAGTMGVSILNHPRSGTGNANTWLVGTDGNGMWRTTNGGANWTQVSTSDIPHGGGQTYYTDTGVLYAGATPYPIRSLDNGATWQDLSNLPRDYYFSVYGDGQTLYTQHSYPVLGGLSTGPFYSSPETGGLTWTPYRGGAQTFNNGPAYMAFDPQNRILYAPMWFNGLWALKVLGGTPVQNLLFANGFE
jgi:hypothetical protein